MTYYDIMGDETTDPDAYVHCAHCYAALKGTLQFEEGTCPKCHANLWTAEDIMTGRMLREQQAALEREIEEWTRLNARKGTP